MRTVVAEQSQIGLRDLLNETAVSHEPVQIIGKGNSAILISEDDWRSIQETLYLLAIPGMRESVLKGLQTPVEDCAEALVW